MQTRPCLSSASPRQSYLQSVVPITSFAADIPKECPCQHAEQLGNAQTNPLAMSGLPEEGHELRPARHAQGVELIASAGNCLCRTAHHVATCPT